MDIKFTFLLLLPVIVCTGQSDKVHLPPYTGRLLSLNVALRELYILNIPLNYDALFFAPALVTLKGEGKKFFKFFENNFKVKVHAKGFHFSENESRIEFAMRFLRYIAGAKNVPAKVREIAAQKAQFLQDIEEESEYKGFIKPSPLYSLVRAMTLFSMKDKLGDGEINNIEVIIKFLLTQFNPQAYNIKDTSNVRDIRALVMGNAGEPVKLSDGSLASQRNKELFGRLVTERSVPQNVKDAMTHILPRM